MTEWIATWYQVSHSDVYGHCKADYPQPFPPLVSLRLAVSPPSRSRFSALSFRHGPWPTLAVVHQDLDRRRVAGQESTPVVCPQRGNGGRDSLRLWDWRTQPLLLHSGHSAYSFRPA